MHACLQLSSLERTHLDSTELLARIKLLESRVSSVTAGSLSPFNQAELMQRVTALEARAGQLEEAAKQATFSVVEVGGCAGRPGPLSGGGTTGLCSHAAIRATPSACVT